MLIAHNVPLCTHYMYKKEAEWGEKKEGDKKAPGMDRERSDGCVNSKEGWRSSEIIQRLLSAVLPQCVCV